MPIDYIPYGVATPRQSELRSDIKAAQEVRDRLVRHQQMMIHQHDGSDFTALESEYGITAGSGEDAFNELSSYLSKANTDDQVTASKTALDQLVAKMG